MPSTNGLFVPVFKIGGSTLGIRGLFWGSYNLWGTGSDKMCALTWGFRLESKGTSKGQLTLELPSNVPTGANGEVGAVMCLSGFNFTDPNQYLNNGLSLICQISPGEVLLRKQVYSGVYTPLDTDITDLAIGYGSVVFRPDRGF